MIVVSVDEGHLDRALGKLRNHLTREGLFVKIKAKKNFLTNAERRKQSRQKGFNRRRKEKEMSVGQVDNRA